MGGGNKKIISAVGFWKIKSKASLFSWRKYEKVLVETA